MESFFFKNTEEDFISISKNILSILLGTVFSIITFWFYGYMLVLNQRNYLIGKASFIEKAGGLALPSFENLQNISTSFRVNCGAFMGLALGIFFGIVISSGINVLQKNKKSSKLIPFILFFTGILICSVIGVSISPKLTYSVFFSLPFIIYFGHSLPNIVLLKKIWFFDLLVSPDDIKKIDSVSYNNPVTLFSKYYLSFVSILLLLLTASLLYFKIRENPIDYIKIRDDILIGTNTGNAINLFYYTYSPYATETIKPLKAKRQLSILYLGNDKNVTKEITRYSKNIRYFLLSTDKEEEAKKLLSEEGIDVLIEDEGLKNLSFASTIILREKNSTLPSSNSINVVKPFLMKNLNTAIRQLSDKTDKANGIRRLLKFALFNYLWVVIVISAFLLILFTTAAFAVISKISIKFMYPAATFLLFSIPLIFAFYLLSARTSNTASIKNQLEMLKNVNDIASLIETGENDNSELRYTTTLLLSEIAKKKKSRRILAALTKSCDDDDPRVRMYSAEGLGNLGYREPVQKLVKMLKDPQLNVRYKAAEALGKINDPSAEMPLQNLIKTNKLWYVSDYALVALRKIKTRKNL